MPNFIRIVKTQVKFRTFHMQAAILLNLRYIFSGPHEKFSFVLLHMLVTSIALEKCKKRMQCALNYSGTRISSIKNQDYSVS